MILNQERIDKGIKKIDNERETYAKKLKAEFKTEEYARINKQVEALKEELAYFHSAMGIDNYINAFYEELTGFLNYMPKDTMILVDDPAHVLARAEACQIEFRESMVNRLEGGYIFAKSDGHSV